MSKLINRFVNDEQGAALVEYGLLIGLIAVVCFFAVQVLGVTINNVLATISASIVAGL